MPGPQTAALVALLRVGKRPWPHYAELVEQRGSATAVLEEELAGVDQPQTTLLPTTGQAELIAQAEADIAAWDSQGIRLVSPLDPDYPDNLRAIHDRPPLIFVAGRLDQADRRAVAVIGTRRPSLRGTTRATELAEHLAHTGYTVVSGLAAGIDTAAHEAVLASRGRTVAVIGTGLMHSYPPKNSDLQDTIAASGAVVSQFWPDTPPDRKNFPLRNAVMSGLALATVIVEASHTSGTRIQARLALAHGRPVLLHRSLLDQDWARALQRGPGTYVFDQSSDATAVIERLWSADTLVA